MAAVAFVPRLGTTAAAPSSTTSPAPRAGAEDGRGATTAVTSPSPSRTVDLVLQFYVGVTPNPNWSISSPLVACGDVVSRISKNSWSLEWPSLLAWTTTFCTSSSLRTSTVLLCWRRPNVSLMPSTMAWG
ncbi:Hypp5328 [Branchiostoma lanceolatum]|uniref:Hypp5328 protein n=1 Tax=Branchiostoma lanceolatum TaxID=7740 RepID=A0A8K0F1D0_BRALA|nr:Hypp5328 [Branchiostoma lanceolatum]